MTDQNNTPERIKALVDKLRAEASRGPLTSREIFALTDPIMDALARADRAAPERRVRGANRSDGGFSVITPPTAAPTDNTALVEAAAKAIHDGPLCANDEAFDPKTHHGEWCIEVVKTVIAALASREAPPAAQEPEPAGCLHGYCDAENCPACSQEEQEAPPACQQEAVKESDLAAARAEIERLTKERDEAIIKAASWESAARLLEAERDEERDDKDTLLRERTILQRKLGVVTARAELAEAERDEARSLLADAERDMRQRAADLCDCACMDGIGDKIRAIGDEILALPLKHADREGGAALAQGQKEGTDDRS